MQGTYFVIIGSNDRLLYEYPKESAMKYASDNEYVLNQFVILSALDYIEEKKKSQTKIENGVSIGSNSVLVAPVTIEENASVGALSVITKDIEKNSLAITRSPLKIFKDWVLDRKKNN